MPVVIPAGASSSSSAQTISGQSVYDYILDDSGAAISGAKVTAILNGEFTTSISPQVLLAPIQRSTTTDGNGFWQLSLIPNSNISPANTTYTIITPFRTYDITVGPSGPYQSTSTGTLVSVVTALAPATTGIIGPLTVTGALVVTAGATIGGGLTVTSGTFSIPGGSFSMAGPLTLTAAASQIIPGATSMSLRNNANSADNLLVSNAGLVTARAGLVATTGGLTVSAGDVAITAGKITMGAATSQLVPGATSFSVRDTANANDNLLVSNAGAVTTRSALTVAAGGLVVTAGGQTITSGNLTLTAGSLTFGAVTSKIVPGATALQLRNNADSASNLALTDAGVGTYRNAIEVPYAAAQALPTHSYGTLPVKIDDQLLSGVAASITFAPNPLPTGFRHLLIEWYARGDTAAPTTQVNLRLNNDSGANYDHQRIYNNAATTVAAVEFLGVTSIQIGYMCAGTATAGFFSAGEAKINHYGGATGNKIIRGNGFQGPTNLTGVQNIDMFSGKWRTTATAITRVDLLPGAGNFVAGSLFTLWGIP